MNIKLQSLVVEDGAPFENDALGRKESAEILTQFIKNIDQPYVMAIDSPWGTGKTTFLKMWQSSLKSQNIHSLYFNAWETDFNDDALISLIKEIESHFASLTLDKRKASNAKNYLQAVKKIGYNLVKKGVPAAVKLATYGIVDASQLTEDVISSIGEEIVKEQFESYEKAKESLHKFRDNLQKFADEVSENGPLVFIIDELDRCRPDYAIQLLEKVKHLFSIKNLVFVLGLDKKQMGCSIQTLYGQGLDVDGYLSRFIDVDYYLPEPNKKKFIEFLIKRHNLELEFFVLRQKYNELKYDQDTIVTVFTGLFNLFNFSLRQIEQIMSQLVVVLMLTKENQFLHPGLLCLLLTLRKARSKLYNDIKNGNFSVEMVLKELELKKYIGVHYENVIAAYLEVSLSYVNRDYHPGEKYEEQKKNLLADDEGLDRLENMVRLIKNISFNCSGNIVDYLVKKIEIAQSFK